MTTPTTPRGEERAARHRLRAIDRAQAAKAKATARRRADVIRDELARPRAKDCRVPDHPRQHDRAAPGAWRRLHRRPMGVPDARRDPPEARSMSIPNQPRAAHVPVVPARACELAAALAELFARDRELARRMNDSQSHLQHANLRLWSGLHPDALALLYDDTEAIGIAADGRIRSEVNAVMIDQLHHGADEHELETVVLAVVQEIHWTIHRAFVDHQRAYEERRQLAVDVGELAPQLADVLTAVGWTEHEARNANVHHLAQRSANQLPCTCSAAATRYGPSSPATCSRTGRSRRRSTRCNSRAGHGRPARTR